MAYNSGTGLITVGNGKRNQLPSV